MKTIILRWKNARMQRWFWLTCLMGLLLLALALNVTRFVGQFADSRQGAALSDLILDNVPTIDLDFLITWGFLFIIMCFASAVAIFQPEDIPFVLLSVAIFAVVRSGFIALTHIGAPLDILKYDWGANILGYFSFTNDLFFSGHTGLPFLAFLIIRNPWPKYFFLFSSLLMGASVLLAHVHYSIDVFAAFFITYGIYKISENLYGRFFNRLQFPAAVTN